MRYMRERCKFAKPRVAENWYDCLWVQVQADNRKSPSWIRNIIRSVHETDCHECPAWKRVRGKKEAAK